MHISVVSPIYKAPTILPELVERLRIALTKITDSFEIILIDDGCPLNSWAIIEELSNKHFFVRGIKLSRNFGQHYAITAGLDYAQGEWVVVMDCDLQDQPEEIWKLYKKGTEEGYDLVLAARENRQDSQFKIYSSKLFFFTLSYLSGANFDYRVGNFGIYSKKVILVINQFREPIRYFPGLVQYIGFKSAMVKVSHALRNEGKTSYSLKRLFNLALEVILAYSDKPLQIIIKIGICITSISFLFIAISIWQWYNNRILVPGFTSIIASLWFLGGLITSTLGIIALYLGKTFQASKNRPIYIVSSSTK
jgi:glycosyltransferase involved in cell wall biosynthesis